ncbi:MAG: putative Fe-S clusters-containing protein containing DUF4445 domain [Candidatus Methanohalarchaeum thermophilum]|uniref:Fe-S clusters-containing protein containing DUF4445 domain n=1 Tax=Methanohalarchaeum thermophilum TaxID=1903181 RepID=A0A1Q6DVK1_METT1|nr:MAG: putative Fe-S clusters-containing protein containing DUF4445 domain [Candidatus Methanohalarchaeum thermophilum]
MGKNLGVAIDIGTSGIRAQAINLDSDKVISTAITMNHPIPGANVMDHLTFAIERGEEVANELMIEAINKLLTLLDVDLSNAVRLSVCGNPIQLSIFENIEIRDLAYVGDKALGKRNVTPPNRDGKTKDSVELGIDLGTNAEVFIPPAIKHEVGADALAMMVKTNFLDEEEPSLVTDYGTNAEMAIKTEDNIYSGSAAAGPAIEGQHIGRGMLARPGSISDINKNNWRNIVLDEELNSESGDVVDPKNGELEEKGKMHNKAEGITGTGVIAAISTAIESNLIDRPKIKTSDKKIHLQDGITLSEKDVEEASKAFGAIRAGHITLMEESNTSFDELKSMYMSGASGTYVDAIKSQNVGLIPPTVDRIYQVGNTSLRLANDLVRNPEYLDELQDIADSVRAKHIMFADDETFETLFTNELAYWHEGMPLDTYNAMIKRDGIQKLPKKKVKPKIHERVKRDIVDLGEKGLRILDKMGGYLIKEFPGCTGCGTCVKVCPENALEMTEKNGSYEIKLNTSKCLGSGCLKCETRCPEKVFEVTNMDLIKKSEEKK